MKNSDLKNQEVIEKPDRKRTALQEQTPVKPKGEANDKEKVDENKMKVSKEIADSITDSSMLEVGLSTLSDLKFEGYEDQKAMFDAQSGSTNRYKPCRYKHTRPPVLTRIVLITSCVCIDPCCILDIVALKRQYVPKGRS